jgi:hypothetical protein
VIFAAGKDLQRESRTGVRVSGFEPMRYATSISRRVPQERSFIILDCILSGS